MLELEALRLQQGPFMLEADLTVPTGARVALIGPSGAGKSTLLSAVAGFLAPVSGRMLWNGENLAQIPPGARPVSILFQEGNLFPHLTVAQNVGLGLRPDLALSRAERLAVAQGLDRVGLTGLEARKPAALSGGQQSRVALARALIRARPLLLLDEPFAALGPGLTTEMLALVGDIVAETGATLLMVTHHPEDARLLTPQTILVVEGRALPPQDTAQLLDHPPATLRPYLG